MTMSVMFVASLGLVPAFFSARLVGVGRVGARIKDQGLIVPVPFSPFFLPSVLGLEDDSFKASRKHMDSVGFSWRCICRKRRSSI